MRKNKSNNTKMKIIGNGDAVSLIIKKGREDLG